jgi:hypothetical protein
VLAFREQIGYGLRMQDIPISNDVNSVEPDQAPDLRKRGRPFEKGNGGRKPGSQNRTTQIAAALMDGKTTDTKP